MVTVWPDDGAIHAALLVIAAKFEWSLDVNELEESVHVSPTSRVTVGTFRDAARHLMGVGTPMLRAMECRVLNSLGRSGS